jgi:MraZ protein
MSIEAVLGHGLLLGTYTPRLDEKQRLLVPAKFRPRLAAGVVMAPGNTARDEDEHCILMFPIDEFLRWFEMTTATPIDDPELAEALKDLTAGSHDDVPDKQGRLSIPAQLRDYAGLQHDVAVVGSGRRAEIWDRARWEARGQRRAADPATRSFKGLAF